MIIGISGRKQSGKDSSAAALVAFGWRRVAFADKLKELAAQFLGIPVEEARREDFKTRRFVVKRDKETPYITGRNVLQHLGVAARNTFGQGFWPAQLFVGLSRADLTFDKHVNIIIPDVRFWSEVEAIHERGGIVIRVNRADRAGVHAWQPYPAQMQRADSPCSFVLTPALAHKPDGDFGGCNLPASAHPTHYSGDQHASETELPDEGSCYAAVFEAASGEAQAAQVAAWVQQQQLMKLPSHGVQDGLA